MDANKEFGIVAIAYNRTESLSRLLDSLSKAEYFGEIIDLVISIDYSGNNSVYNMATEFEWKFGNKRIIHHSKNLGLRSHILFCGSLTKEYKNICVFEDDIFVSPAFYNFAKQAVKFYEKDESVAGISLYTHMWNQFVDRPFTCISNENDVFLLQQAKSWGQIWSESKWADFISWYDMNKDMNLEDKNFPKAITNWSKSSWLKYHIKYLVDNNKYFVYPKQSLTTNFSDIGTHAMVASNCYQVPLEMGTNKIYNFQKSIEINYIYDVFFENKFLYDILNLNESELTIDLYGQKISYKKFLLTTKKLNFEIIKTYGLHLRPHELNVIYNISGEDIFLYNTNKKASNPTKKHFDINLFLYDIKTSAKKDLMKASFYFYFRAFKIKIHQVFSNFN
jgi:hypothetical protein